MKINLDICNFCRYDDIYRPTEFVRHVCEALAGHYPMVHAKDLIVSDDVHIHIDETTFGEGTMDWKTALQYIASDLPEQGWVVLEHAKTIKAA